MKWGLKKINTRRCLASIIFYVILKLIPEVYKLYNIPFIPIIFETPQKKKGVIETSEYFFFLEFKPSKVLNHN